MRFSVKSTLWTWKADSLFCRVERSEYDIYIGNFPFHFEEKDLRDLFEEHNIEVGVIRLKHCGTKT